MADPIAGLYADLGANSAAFKKDMRAAARDLQSGSAKMNRALGVLDDKFYKSRQRLDRLASTTLKALPAAVAAGAAAFAASTKKALDSADATAKAADAGALHINTLQGLRYQATQSGVATDSLDRSLQDYAKRVGEARAETGELVAFLGKVDPALLENIKNARSQEEALRLVADAIAAQEDAAVRAKLADAAFGGEFAKMAHMFRGGAADIDKYRAKADELGITFDTNLARGAELANNALDTLKWTAGQQLTAALIRSSGQIEVLANRAIENLPKVIHWAERLMDTLGFRADPKGVDEITARIARLNVEIKDMQDAQGANAVGARMVTVAGPIFGGKVADWLEDISGFNDKLESKIQERADLYARLQGIGAYGAAPEIAPLDLGGDGALPEFDPFTLPDTGDAEDGLKRILALAEAAIADNEARAAGYFDQTREAAERYQATLGDIATLERAGAFEGMGDVAARARVQALLDIAGATEDISGGLDRVRELAADGLIDPRNLKLAEAALKDMVDHGDDVETLGASLRGVAIGGARQLGHELLDVLSHVDSLKDGFSDLLSFVVREIQRVALERTLVKPLEDWINGVFDRIGGSGGGGGGGLLAAIGVGASFLGGFNHGGAFAMAGAGGIDRNLVTLKMGNGEVGRIYSRREVQAGLAHGGAAGGGGRAPVTINAFGGGGEQVAELRSALTALGYQVEVQGQAAAARDRAFGPAVDARISDSIKRGRVR